MRDIDRIRHALAAAAQRGDAAMLATVVEIEGSVYRGAGARMLVTGSGDVTGAVSGGCLEADIVARTSEVLQRNRAEVARYDTRASDDVVLGLGLGCQGVIDVLLEPFVADALATASTFYAWLADQREPVTLVTVIEERDGFAVGGHVTLSGDGSVLEGDPGIASLDAGTRREHIRPALRLLVCGAGSDAIPVVRCAKSLGWHVTVADHRPALLTHARFPDADALCSVNAADEPATFAARVAGGTHGAVVVMAHAATHDRAYLHAAIDAGVPYVGVLGPRRRTLELLAGRECPRSVHAPVGLDIGAESPEEIALAIVAEVAAATAGRPGTSLRERNGPIHESRH